MPQHIVHIADLDRVEKSRIGRSNHPMWSALFVLVVLFAGTQESIAAPGDHVHTEPTGTLSAVGADASYYWAAVNTAMYVDLNLASPDDVDYISGALVSGNYVDSYWDGGTKGQCVPYEHATDSRWTAFDTGYTTISVTLRDKTDNPEANDINPVKTLADTVGGFRLDSGKATQYYNNQPTYISVTVLNPGNNGLWICIGSKYKLEANTTPAAGPFRVWIRYDHIDDSNNSSIGHFGGSDPEFGPLATDAGDLMAIGVDVDRDAVLDAPTEKTVWIAVNAASFGTYWIKDQRTSPADIAEPLFELQSGEHMEVGGTFAFKLESQDVLDPSPVRYYLTGTTKAGRGTTFSHTWAAGETGSHYVRFYMDCNGNDQYDFGESYIDSPTFSVQSKKVYTFSTVYSTALTAPSEAQLSAYYATSANLGLKRDSSDDWRACVEFVLGTLVEDTSGGPDPVTVGVNSSTWLNQAHNVTLVDSMDANGAAYRPSDPPKIILNWQPPDPTFIHEVGHTVNLVHYEGSDTARIMYQGGSARNKLTASEADALD